MAKTTRTTATQDPVELFRRLSKKYSTPYQVQELVRSIPYNSEPLGETVRSAWSAFHANEAHCLEAAFIAAAILEHHGYPPLVVSLESQDNLDHVVFVFREKGRWGAIGRSREEGLHGRSPDFRSIRHLAYSYYEPFIDDTGRITAYGLANLDDSGTDWRYSRRNVWAAEQFLIDLRHKKLRGSRMRYLKWFNYFLRTGESGKKSRHWW